jgi:SNF2 family DNA or RNA helicase
MRICLTTELLAHQRAAAEKMLSTRVGALFMDMGTGKSRTAIELAAARQDRIDKVVWFTLVSLKETVRHEIKKHTTATDADICLFDQRTSDAAIPAAGWYVIGLESMGSSSRVTLAVNKLVTTRTMVIVDESSYIKGHRAKRTNRVTALAERARYRLILTGTPISQGVQDLFSQMRFLSPRILGYRSWYSFARNHLEYSDRYLGLIVNTHNEEWLAAKIQPYVYQVTKDECLDLPVKLSESYYCRLTAEQREYYDRAKQDFFEDVMAYDRPNSQFQSSIPIFRLFSRLQSICCGFSRGDDGRVTALDNNRLDLLLLVIERIGPEEKIVIWGKYRPAIDLIVEGLVERYEQAAVCQYHGGLDERRRHQEVSRWRESGRFLVATQEAGGHGLDLTSARTEIFYGNGFKYSSRIQAEDRCHRIGQTRPVTYIDIWSHCGIEERIASALSAKGDAVQRFKEEIDLVKDNGTDRKSMIKRLLEKL